MDRWRLGIYGVRTARRSSGIILGSFFEEGANMTGQSFGGGTNYDDEYIRRDPSPGNVTVSFSPCWLWHPISSVPTGRSCIARWNTSVNSFGELRRDRRKQGEEILLKLFDQAKRMDQENNMGFKNTIRECGTQIAYNLSYEERLQLLAFLAEIAKSDGNVCAARSMP